MSKKVFITDSKRTAITNFGGTLRDLSPVEIGVQCLEKILIDTPELKSKTDMVVIGNVLSAGHGQNIARQVAIKAGINQEIPAFTINHVCGSSMQAIITGMNYIQAGNADIVIAGGTESMSSAAFAMPNYRWENKMGHSLLIDTMIHDGLWDAFNDIHMGVTAENIAKQWKITRDQQDEFAFKSQQKASKAQKSGLFKDEIIPITIKTKKETKLIEDDEFIRHDISIEKLKKLKPAFNKEGTVTAGNASGLNDGACFVVLMSEEKAKELNQKTKIRIHEANMIGNDPKIMGVAPTEAITKLLKKTNHTVNDIDCFEINEAFAAQSIAIQNTLNIPEEKLNINGGAIALGHPIGASGARITTTLVHEMIREKLGTGIASLCIGGGQAISLMLKQEK
ncbi:MAG: acetyl-CoA C-acyltransferase [Actinobacteria bacterium]|nr:acetyl-CoA C-acyltransferase [Actinomycetota bacterium]